MRDGTAQEILKKARDLIKDGKEVSVRIVPEPDNHYDSKAIALQCNVDSKWQRIGYIVREALDCVHQALSSRKIDSVHFVWVKYLLTFPRSGPVYFAGIDICILSTTMNVCKPFTIVGHSPLQW